jgi:hypothetical protein
MAIKIPAEIRVAIVDCVQSSPLFGAQATGNVSGVLGGPTVGVPRWLRYSNLRHLFLEEQRRGRYVCSGYYRSGSGGTGFCRCQRRTYVCFTEASCCILVMVHPCRKSGARG